MFREVVAMLKRSVLFVLPVTILSLASSVGWAQLKPVSAKKVSAVRKTYLQNKAILNSQIFLREQAPWVLMGQTALNEKQIQARCLQRVQQTQQRIYQENIAKHPPVIGEEIQTNSAKLIFRGKEIGALKRGEHLVMGAAYDAQKRQVAQLQKTLSDGQVLLSTELERALQAYGIETVMLVIRSAATPKKRAQTRLLIYHVSTGEVTDKYVDAKK